MKKLFYILIVLVAFSCDTENAWDCIQNEGAIVQQEFNVSAFTKILVNRDVQLFISTAPEAKVIVESGENLLSDIRVEVVNNQLLLTDNNTCNLVRPYGITKIYVEAPNIIEIQNSSQFEVQSQGLLNFSNLRLVSEDFNAPGSFTVGDFRLVVDMDAIEIVSNNISSFYLSGHVNQLDIGFFSGAGRFEGANLIAQEIDVFHRGSNDMIVNPQLALRGELRGTGNLISVNQPPIVEIDQYYIGELIFED